MNSHPREDDEESRMNARNRNIRWEIQKDLESQEEIRKSQDGKLEKNLTVKPIRLHQGFFAAGKLLSAKHDFLSDLSWTINALLMKHE